ncbi:MAG TPA: quinolinate synthase NadA [Gammaproteobacteria bacterium]|nr:quinolinate synthase NadA [Gammaproteobacteria bacterium]
MNIQIENAIDLMAKQDCKLVSHYYTNPLVQDLAENSGGFVGDSLDMAIWSRKQSCQSILVAGVYFMAETIKILNPDKHVYIVDENATCSLDLSCGYDDFMLFCQNNPDRTVIAYINTSAKVKTLADWVVTSRKAVELIYYLECKGEKILWAPDKHMGSYLKQETKADILCWDGACIVHESLKAKGIANLIEKNPDAAVFVHPEAPLEVINLATLVGSTKDMIDQIQKIKNKQIIVATDRGIIYKLTKIAPEKEIIEAPSGGTGATCVACAHCPWMEMNTLDKIISQLNHKNSEILLDEEIIYKAQRPLEKMLNIDNLIYRY